MALFHLSVTQTKRAQDSPLLLLPPTVPGSDCIASITANTATTPARAA